MRGVDCLAGFIEALGLGAPHVLGHSFGAGLALELYRRHPSIARSLVLAGPYAGWAGSLPPEEVEHRLRLALETAAPARQLRATVDSRALLTPCPLGGRSTWRR